MRRPLFFAAALLFYAWSARAENKPPVKTPVARTKGLTKAPSSSPATPPTGRGRSSLGQATVGHAGSTKRAPVARVRNPAVELYQVNRKETLVLRLRDDKGRPIKGLQRRFDQFSRCHYTNTVHAMNPRLVKMLYDVGRHWPGRRIEVFSGYRHPNVAKNPHSPHMQGLACDFRVAGVANTELRDYLRKSFERVGVGYYPNSSFVHLDARKDRSAFWIDYSGPGERAMYSATPADDVRNGRAERFKPGKIDPSWATQDDEPSPEAGEQPGEQPTPPEGSAGVTRAGAAEPDSD
jgi:uncharacterized protein YcbK (DUF882 family)